MYGWLNTYVTWIHGEFTCILNSLFKDSSNKCNVDTFIWCSFSENKGLVAESNREILQKNNIKRVMLCCFLSRHPFFMKKKCFVSSVQFINITLIFVENFYINVTIWAMFNFSVILTVVFVVSSWLWNLLKILYLQKKKQQVNTCKYMALRITNKSEC